MKKSVLILAMLALVFTGCEKENIEQQDSVTVDLQTRRGFPQSITLEDYFELSINSCVSPRGSDFVEFGAKNETEWFIKDINNIIQYYSFDEQTEMLHAINEFSGRIIDYENDTNRGTQVCSMQLGHGCNLVVSEYLFFSTTTITCGSHVSTQYYAGGLPMAVYICAVAATL